MPFLVEVHRLFHELKVQSLRTCLGLPWPELVLPQLFIGQVTIALPVLSFLSGDTMYDKSLTNLGNMMTTHHNFPFLYLFFLRKFEAAVLGSKETL